MRKEDKRVIKDILQGKDLEMNLPVYAGFLHQYHI